MRIIVVSHPSILDINRRLYIELAKCNHQVMLVVPSRWKNEFGKRPLQPEPLADSATGNVSLRCCRVAMAGRIACQFYLLTPWIDLARWRPDIVFIDEEPWSLATVQWALFARLMRCPLVAWTHENRMR